MIILGVTPITPHLIPDDELRRRIEEAKKRGDTVRAAMLEDILNARSGNKPI